MFGVANPAIIIGLGGTGKWVLTYVKKNLLETYGGKMPNAVRLISFDTTRVRVKVQRLLPFGLLVALDDGQMGIIREREIAWNRRLRRRWRKRFKVGDVLEAVLMGTGHGQRLELSLRLSEADPRVTLSEQYSLGERVGGSVTGVQPYGVCIEIEAGITGLLHVSCLPLWVEEYRVGSGLADEIATKKFWIGTNSHEDSDQIYRSADKNLRSMLTGANVCKSQDFQGQSKWIKPKNFNVFGTNIIEGFTSWGLLHLHKRLPLSLLTSRVSLLTSRGKGTPQSTPIINGVCCSNYSPNAVNTYSNFRNPHSVACTQENYAVNIDPLSEYIMMFSNSWHHNSGLIYNCVDDSCNPAETNPPLDYIIQMVDAEAGLWQYEYDAMGNLLREVDANGHADSFTYAHVYRLLSYTDAEDIVTLFSYKENGNRLTLTDGNGHTTTYTYDELDRLATVTNEEDETTSCRYDWMGNQTAMISADGVVTRYDYDPFYRLIRVTLNELAGEPETNDVNVGTNYGYDAVGNRTSLTYADGRVVMYGYYQNDWLQIVTEPEDNVTSYEQDVLGLMTCTNNPNSTVSDAIYAKANCMLTLVNQQVGGAIKTNRAFTYTYDEVGQRTEMVLSMRGAIRPSSLISTPMTRALSKRRSHDVVSIL